MSSTLTNTNCEMKSMQVYSASFAMANHSSADLNECVFSTFLWEFENQLKVAHIGKSFSIHLNIDIRLTVILNWTWIMRMTKYAVDRRKLIVSA